MAARRRIQNAAERRAVASVEPSPTSRGRGSGFASPQAAWNGFAKIILPHIGAGDDEMLVCGMALGYADESALVNTFRTPRVGVQAFTTWLE